MVLEPPCFTDSIAALGEYLEGKTVAGMLVAYHGAGASCPRGPRPQRWNGSHGPACGYRPR